MGSLQFVYILQNGKTDSPEAMRGDPMKTLSDEEELGVANDMDAFV